MLTVSEIHVLAYLEQLPRCILCGDTATQALKDGNDLIRGHYCDFHAPKELEAFKARA